MTPEMERYLVAYRERFGGAGCRIDSCADRAILMAIRAVLWRRSKGAVRRAFWYGWVMNRERWRVGLATHRRFRRYMQELGTDWPKVRLPLPASYSKN